MKYKFSLLLFGIFVLYLGCNSTLPKEKEMATKEEIKDEKLPIEIPNLVSEISLPKGFERKNTTVYGDWMRNLKLQKENVVYYFNGNKKYNQGIHVAVLDMDIGTKDLQQCADACMRIRAEYLLEQKKYNEITFLLASGKWKSFTEYTSSREYKGFRKYMNYIFSYANTASLKKQLKPVKSFEEIEIGDVLVQSGNPYGHAVTVMDICENEAGEKQFMLSQSYIPAQSIEILINPQSSSGSPWYPVNFEGILETPEWNFYKEDLRRF